MTYGTFSCLCISIRAGVAVVTITHPPVNLLDAKLLTELDHFVDQVRHDENVRVIVFQSGDPEFFVAHGDMNFVTDPHSLSAVKIAGAADQSLNPMQRFHERVRSLPQVTIGKLSGWASGGGAEFLTAMDMRFAAIGTSGLAQNEVLTGIIPGAGATAYLPRLMGRARALEVMLGAERFDAERAEQYGWINRAMPAEELDAFVTELAYNIAGLAPGVISAAKACLEDSADSIREALRMQNVQVSTLFAKPLAVKLNQEALDAGAQTRNGELKLDATLRHLSEH